VQAVESPAGWEDQRDGSAPMTLAGVSNGPMQVAMQPLAAPMPMARPPGAPPPITAQRTSTMMGAMPSKAKKALDLGESSVEPPGEASRNRQAPARSAPPRPASSTPPPPMYSSPGPVPRSPKAESAKEVAPDASAYLASLAQLAGELEAQARGRADGTAIRLLRQRLVEWIEDLRSVGGHDALAAAVERLVQRLSAALAAGSDVASETLAVATELGKIAGGPPPPKGRVAFWK